MSGRRPRCAAAALALGAALALVACGSSDGGSTATTTTTAITGAPLTGTQWVLDGGDTAWLRFENGGQVTGNDGCNGFSGGYTGAGAALRIGPLAGTRKLCPPPADALSTRVLAGLEATRRYEIAGPDLRLLDGGGREVLRYGATNPSVEGRWTATSVLYKDAIRGVIEQTELTANFTPDGKVSGSGGCNSFGADYTAPTPALRITGLSATERACTTPEGANEQEQGYFAALASARTYEQVGGRLTLLDAQGRMAVIFQRTT